MFYIPCISFLIIYKIFDIFCLLLSLKYFKIHNNCLKLKFVKFSEVFESFGCNIFFLNESLVAIFDFGNKKSFPQQQIGSILNPISNIIRTSRPPILLFKIPRESISYIVSRSSYRDITQSLHLVHFRNIGFLVQLSRLQ